MTLGRAVEMGKPMDPASLHDDALGLKGDGNMYVHAREHGALAVFTFLWLL